MDKFYAPNFIGYFPLANGKPAAGGHLVVCRTGTDILAPVYDENGTLIASSRVPIDSAGRAHFLLDPTITYRIKVVPPPDVDAINTAVYDNVRVAECNVTGMTNPMTGSYQMIIGGAQGAPEALEAPTAGGQIIMAINLGHGHIAPQWTGFYAGSGINFSSEADGYHINADTQDGDHKSKVSASDNDPDYLINKILNGANIQVAENVDEHGYHTLVVSADTQTGDRKVKLNATDASPSYLADKLVDGDGIKFTNNGTSLTIAFDNPMDGLGQLIYGGVDGALTKLAIGAEGYVLKSRSGIPAWEAETVGMTNPMTSLGDLIVGGASGSPVRLGVGADYQILTSLNGNIGWAAPAVQTGDHKTIVSSGDSSPDYLGNKIVAGANIIITDNGTYLTISAAGGGGGMTNPMDGVGQMIMGMTSGTPYKLAAPTSNYMVLGVTTMGLGSVPEWKYAGNALNKGLAQTWDGQASGFTKGDIIFGGDALAGAGDITGNTEVSFLHIGTEGQVLKVGASGVPEWANESGGGGATMQENFSLLNADNSYAVAGKVKTLYGTKVVSNETATRTKLGFFHKSGTTGYVLLGVYDNSGALLAQTAKFSPTNATIEQMCWANTLSSFTMTAGEEYWFVAFFDEDNWQCNIEVVGKTYPTAFDANLCASRYVGARNDLPATLSGMTADTQLFYMGAS